MTYIPEPDDRWEPIIGLVNSDREKGMAELTKLAESGTKWAIHSLGLYLSEQDETTDEAVKWLLLAEQFDSADAAWNLAMIAHGRGQVDETKRWIDRAAELGEADARAIQADGYDVEKFLATLRI